LMNYLSVICPLPLRVRNLSGQEVEQKLKISR
jgi:hypothetical protein